MLSNGSLNITTGIVQLRIAAVSLDGLILANQHHKRISPGLAINAVKSELFLEKKLKN